MKAKAIREHFISIGTWVNWDLTEDHFLHGDPQSDITGIAVAWIPTSDLIEEAARQDLNLFITHEPAFYPGYEKAESTQTLIERKKHLLEKNEIVLLRCHDTWDRMPEIGIVDSWAAALGFETLPRSTHSFYRICLTENLTSYEIASNILEKVKPYGQNSVLHFGDPNRRIKRMAVGTGAITWLPDMHALDADLLLVTEDGMNYWTSALWAHDLHLPLIIVNHAVSEIPGMKALATYLQSQFPNIPVKYLDLPYNLSTIS
jgi:putative NIF3 family GTP cyclohydrolase 1 type 2